MVEYRLGRPAEEDKRSDRYAGESLRDMRTLERRRRRLSTLTCMEGAGRRCAELGGARSR